LKPEGCEQLLVLEDFPDKKEILSIANIERAGNFQFRLTSSMEVL